MSATKLSAVAAAESEIESEREREEVRGGGSGEEVVVEEELVGRGRKGEEEKMSMGGVREGCGGVRA
jgi:hypothetical protein